VRVGLGVGELGIVVGKGDDVAAACVG